MKFLSLKNCLAIIPFIATLQTFSQTNILPSSGHAGIGTTTPGAPLEIATTLTPGAVVFKFSNSQQNDQILFKDRDYAKFLNGIEANKLLLGINGYDNKIMSSTINGNNIEFWPTLAVNSTNNILINPGQYVGIGNVAPQHMLDVTGNIKTSASLLVGANFLLNGSNGNFQNGAWAGAVNRILYTDASGNVSPLAAGNSNQVLYGNGVWGNLPAALSSFSAIGNTLYIANTTNFGIGTSNPQYPLDVVGDARISNNLFVGGGIVITDNLHAAESVTTSLLKADTIRMATTGIIDGATYVRGDISGSNKLTVAGNATFNGNLQNSTMAGTGDRIVYVDAGGNFRTGPGSTPPGVNGPCLPSSLPWYEGGNSYPANLEIGTCTNHEFILKTNGINRAWFQVDGTISFGSKIISNTNGPEYKFDQGAIRLSGNNTYGGPQVVFHNLPTSPYGDWSIEYTGGTTAPHAGLNFWKPFASPYANNNIMFLADNGNIGMGTDNPLSRLTLDSWSGDGLRVYSGIHSTKAISLQYKNGNSFSENFIVNGDGVTWIGTNISSVGNTQLIVGQGSSTAKNISLVNNSSPSNIKELFNVYGSGKTEIISSASNLTDEVFTITDGLNNNKNFSIKKNGQVLIGTTGSTSHAGAEMMVKGTIVCQELYVTKLGDWPDFVFKPTYKLLPLSEVEAFYKKENHLPGVPSESELAEKDLNVGEMNAILLKKIEELTIYTVQLNKEIEALKKNQNK